MEMKTILKAENFCLQMLINLYYYERREITLFTVKVNQSLCKNQVKVATLKYFYARLLLRNSKFRNIFKTFWEKAKNSLKKCDFR